MPPILVSGILAAMPFSVTRGQTEDNAQAVDAAAQPLPQPSAPFPARADSGVALIRPLGVPRFTPPAPKAPLPPVDALSRRVIATDDGGSLTIEKINPPDPATYIEAPQRPAANPALLSAQFRAERAAWNKAHPRVFLSFSATVYDHMYTHLQWRHEDRPYEAWSNVDFGLLSGIGSFQQGNTTYNLYFIPENRSTRPVARPKWLNRLPPKPPVIPVIPELPSTPAFVITKGDPSDTTAFAGIQALHDLWAKENVALAKFHQDLEQYHREYTAWQKDHPPGPEHNTVRYWVERHAANESDNTPAPVGTEGTP